MADPTGNWTINGNGWLGALAITGVDASGNLQGCTAYGQEIQGFFNADDGRISFMRLIDRLNPSSYQFYTGYYMPPQGDGTPAMAGTFQGFAGTAATAAQCTYGWFATPAN